MSLPGALQVATLYISIKVQIAVNTPQVAYRLLFDAQGPSLESAIY